MPVQDFWKEADARRKRQGYLLAWVRSLPGDVDGPAGMIKLLRHLLADMDAVASVLEQETQIGEAPEKEE